MVASNRQGPLSSFKSLDVAGFVLWFVVKLIQHVKEILRYLVFIVVSEAENWEFIIA